MLEDIRYTLRASRRTPILAIVAVLVLTMGIGMSVLIFSVVKAVLLQPLPYPEADRLVQLEYQFRRTGGTREWVLNRDVKDWRQQNNSFERIGFYRGSLLNLTEGDQAEALVCAQITTDLLPTLGVQPALGRNFSALEEQPGNDKVIILSDDLWRRRFNSDPGVVGRSIDLNQEKWIVVGVMPPRFNFPLRIYGSESNPTERISCWRPLAWPAASDRKFDGLSGWAVGRLKAGISLKQAQSDMSRVSDQLSREYPETNAELSARLITLADYTFGETGHFLLIVFAAIGLVMLIACMNLANLLLLRMLSRNKELAIRKALGASRWHLVRLSFIESLVLAFAGGIAGLLLSSFALNLVVRLLPQYIPRVGDTRIDGTVLAFTLGLTFLTGILCGLGSAWQSSRMNIYGSLKGSNTGASPGQPSRTSRNLLIIGEIALTLTLTAGAGLLVRSFIRLSSVDLGFQSEHVLVALIYQYGPNYKERYQNFALFDGLLERFRGFPGVQSVAWAGRVPLSGVTGPQPVEIEGRPPASQSDTDLLADENPVTPGYFQTLGMSLQRGRLFTEQDNLGSLDVAIINETAARRLWPGEDPIGKRLNIDERDQKPVWRQVVGIMKDVRQWGIGEPVKPQIYIPAYQTNGAGSYLVVKSDIPLENLAAAVRRQLAEIDKTQSVYVMTSMEELVSNATSTRRMSAMLLSAFGGLALLLAAIGVYGAISYSVAQRNREIGIRIALGAQPRDVLRMVLRQGLALALVGVIAGLALFLVSSPLLANLLYGVRATDPTIITIVTVVIVGITLLACYLPARKVAIIDPLIVLRDE